MHSKKWKKSRYSQDIHLGDTYVTNQPPILYLIKRIQEKKLSRKIYIHIFLSMGKIYHNGFPQKIFKSLLENPHVINIALNRRSSVKKWEIITSQWNILIVFPSPLIHVGEIIIMVHFFNNPFQQWNNAQSQTTKTFKS